MCDIANPWHDGERESVLQDGHLQRSSGAAPPPVWRSSGKKYRGGLMTLREEYVLECICIFTK